MKKFVVEFHFPGSSITIEQVPKDQMGEWQTRAAGGRMFYARGRDYKGEETETQFQINPAMLTYIKVHPYDEWSPF